MRVWIGRRGLEPFLNGWNGVEALLEGGGFVRIEVLHAIIAIILQLLHRDKACLGGVASN